jgi:hypothetical protein
MAFSPEQLRTALGDLNGQRGDVRVEFDTKSALVIKNAILVPVEEDNLIKLTDGTHEYLVDATRVVWVEIG